MSFIITILTIFANFTGSFVSTLYNFFILPWALGQFALVNVGGSLLACYFGGKIMIALFRLIRSASFGRIYRLSGYVEHILNLLRGWKNRVSRQASNASITAAATLTVGNSIWVNLGKLCLTVCRIPLALFLLAYRKLATFFRYLRDNPGQTASCLSLGIGAGIWYSYRHIKRQHDKGLVAGANVELDRATLVPESRLASSFPPLVDVLRRFVLAGCAYVSILGVLRGMADNRVITDIVFLFTSILKLLLPEDRGHKCTASDRCCELRNWNKSLLRNLTGCSCSCHEFELESDGRPVDPGASLSLRSYLRSLYSEPTKKETIDSTVNRINLLASASTDAAAGIGAAVSDDTFDGAGVGFGTFSPRTRDNIVSDTTLSSDDESEIEIVLDQAQALVGSGDDIVSEDIGSMVKVYRITRRVVSRIFEILKRVVTGPQMVLGVAFVVGFVAGSSIYYFLPALSNWALRRKLDAERAAGVVHSVVTKQYAVVPITEEVEATTLTRQQDMSTDLAFRNLRGLSMGPVVHIGARSVRGRTTVELTESRGLESHSDDEEEEKLETKSRKNQNRRARIKQGQYKKAGMDEDDLRDDDAWKREQEEIEEKLNRQDRRFLPEDDYVTSWIDAVEAEEEEAWRREELARDMERTYGWQGRYAVEESLSCATMPECLSPVNVNALSDRAEVNPESPIFTLETSKGMVKTFVAVCPLCNNGQKHRVHSCPKNSRKNWVFVSKKSGWTPKVELGKDVLEHEFGFIVNKDNCTFNNKEHTIFLKTQQSKVEGVPIVDCQRLMEYVTPLYTAEKTTPIHVSVPVGNVLWGPFHGDSDKGLFVREVTADGKEIWHELKKAELSPGVPAYWSGDDLVAYEKPNFVRSVHISSFDPSEDLPMVYLVGLFNNRVAMSGPRKLKGVENSVVPTARFPWLLHDCSSDFGFSGGALVRADTGGVIGMHLGTVQKGVKNYAVLLDVKDLRDFSVKPRPKKAKVPANGTVGSLNS